ncbi:hypothetical protein D5Q54_19025 [Vibrio cholerae]|nr:hypothetical protein [Vibrio cholerae]
MLFNQKCPNKAFKSDSQRLAFSLRSSIAKRRSHLNAALGVQYSQFCFIFVDAFPLIMYKSF